MLSPLHPWGRTWVLYPHLHGYQVVKVLLGLLPYFSLPAVPKYCYLFRLNESQHRLKDGGSQLLRCFSRKNSCINTTVLSI